MVVGLYKLIGGGTTDISVFDLKVVELKCKQQLFKSSINTLVEKTYQNNPPSIDCGLIGPLFENFVNKILTLKWF